MATSETETVSKFVALASRAGFKLPSGANLTAENFARNYHFTFYDLNRRSGRHHVFRDKLIFDAIVKSCGLESPGNIGLFRKGRFRSFSDNKEHPLAKFLHQTPGEYFVKERDGAGGNGSFLLTAEASGFFANGEEISDQDLHDRLSQMPGGALIQSAIRQHDEMASMNPSSINTLRVITAFGRNDDRPTVMATALRIGRAGIVVDNAAAGGMFCHVDLHEGMLTGPLRTKSGACYLTHPDSDKALNGLTVPFFFKSIDDCCTLHELIGPAPVTVGWDVAISCHGPIFVEGNMYWDPTLHLEDKGFRLRMASKVVESGCEYLWKKT